MTYTFGPFTFDWFKLWRDGEPVDLEYQEVEVLRMLVEWAESHPKAYVNKEEMKKRLWSDGLTIEDPNHSLSVAVAKLRNKLRKRPDGEPYVTTGQYRLDARVERVEGAGPAGGAHGGEGPRPAALPAAGADPLNSPYVGPQPFPRERSADFFGRGDEVRDLVRILSDKDSRVVALYSPSGAGKTSLINTALRDALIEEGYQVLPTARVGVPAGTHGPVPGQNQYTFAAIASMEQRDEAVPSQGALTWAGYLSLKGAGSRSVLVIDQLEEIVTTDKSGSPRQREEFFVELREA
ncbi:MAG TPA: winged helix-turn-helix domain-containing protein, partial [Pyrinomonadaceae bacterium]